MRYDRTLFIKGIPQELPDTIINTALNSIPGFLSFVRCIQYDSTNTEFGFAEFSSSKFLSLATSILKNIQILKDDPEKRLFVSPDKSLYDRQAFDNDQVPDQGLIAQLNAVFLSWIKTDDTVLSSLNNASSSWGQNNDVYEIVKRSLKEDQSLNEVIGDLTDHEIERLKNEIREFRKDSLEFEQKRGKEAESYEKQSQTQLLQESVSDKEVTSKLINVNITDESEGSSEYPATDEEDYELELKKEEALKAGTERLFKDAEKRWIHREDYRMRAFSRKRNTDQELSDREKESSINKYRNFDDDDAVVQQSMEYFTNHASWAKKRRDFRARELHRDAKDILDEAEELKNNSEDVADAPGVTQDTSTTKISLSFSKKNSEHANGWTDSNTEEHKTSLKPIHSLNGANDTDKQLDDGKIKEIESSIPSDIPSLGEYAVKWDSLSDASIEDVVRPFVIESIVEYLGVEEEELIEFIICHVRDHKALSDLVTELEITLDEDAQGFSKDLWRLLILESEKEAARSSLQ